MIIKRKETCVQGAEDEIKKSIIEYVSEYICKEPKKEESMQMKKGK